MMYGDILLIDREGSDPKRAERLAFGDTSGRNEAWLRDTLLAHPELLPVREIDPSFAPIIPLCRELRTEAGPIDAAFINSDGRLTLVECKLWRNPEARRKVVAQTLDYARAVSRWSYSDLQRQVAVATGQSGNVPFERARAAVPGLEERRFVDETSRALRQGRFLLVIAGDGIREDVGGITELINRNAALAFAFGLVEVALYGLEDGGLLVQSRVVARTQIIERTVVVVRDGTQTAVIDDEPDGLAPGPADDSNRLGESDRQAAYRRFWQPVLDARFDDPDQEPAKLYWPNNVRAALPWKNAWILGFGSANSQGLGVCTAGRNGADQDMLKALEPERDTILAELPPGTEYRRFTTGNGMTFSCRRNWFDFADDTARAEWVAETMNQFANVLRPRLKRIQSAVER